jgi:hypothetical protein
MTEEEFNEFEKESHDFLMKQQAILQNEFGLGNYDRWDFNQETGEFIFSDNEEIKIAANFQIVGTLSNISQTWLWSWANPNLTDVVKKDIYKVKEFGEKHHLPELIEEKWMASEDDAWAMTCIANNILQTKGAYKCPHDSGSVFVIFTDVRLPKNIL